VLSTLVAGLPVVVLLGSIAALKIRIHYAALIGLGVAVAIAVAVYRMPVAAAAATTGYGAAYGLFPIGWIILNLIFLYQLTVNKGLFEVLRTHLATLAPDPRVQVILIAFSFGAFFEGAAGFGTPVAVTAAILIQLGFKPLSACGLSLIANTAPVAFGALGTPIIALSKVTGIDEFTLSKMAGRQLPFFSVIVPFWVVWAFSGFRGMLGVWPAALTAGVAFAIPQFLVSNFHGPWLVDIVASLASIGAVMVLLRFWKPKAAVAETKPELPPKPDPVRLRQAWVPWILLSVCVFVWGIPAFKLMANKIAPKFEVPALHNVVVRSYPVVERPTVGKPTPPEKAVYELNWLSATGTGILVSAIIAGLLMGYTGRELLRHYGQTLIKVRLSLITIAAMLGVGLRDEILGHGRHAGPCAREDGWTVPVLRHVARVARSRTDGQ
jgi:lactate permease